MVAIFFQSYMNVLYIILTFIKRELFYLLYQSFNIFYIYHINFQIINIQFVSKFFCLKYLHLRKDSTEKNV
jgi:hypothetical protein